jgi:rubrerythrin
MLRARRAVTTSGSGCAPPTRMVFHEWVSDGRVFDGRVPDGDGNGEQDVRATLVRILQDAHAGELAAAYAYQGHARSLRRHPVARAEVERIEAAEWHHRRLVAGLLESLHARPRRRREWLMATTGRFFGGLCFVGGWFAPMYAAGRLEWMNVGQYESARDAARALGLDEAAVQLEEMTAEEDRHERWFGDQCRGHWMLPYATRLFGWRPPEPVIAPAAG